MRAALAVDPQRIFKPISGRFSHSPKPWDLPAELWPNAIDDGHPYSGWYGKTVPQTWSNLQIWSPRRMVTLGEFGAEALDAYETMRDHYPPQLQPAAAGGRHALGRLAGRETRRAADRRPRPQSREPRANTSKPARTTRRPLLADKVIGMRLSPRAIAGYFHFHFIDVVPAFWPKSIVSHDHRPKKAYYQLAQLNQPVVALPQLSGAKPDAMTLWVANDLPEAFPKATLRWTVSARGKALLEGRQTLDVPALGAAAGKKIDLLPVTTNVPAFDIELSLADKDGGLLSRYRRTVRVVPVELLKPSKPAKK